MTTVSVLLDDDLDAALETLSESQGRRKEVIVGDVLRKYLRTERLRQTLQNPALQAQYEQLAAEDVHLAEAGMEDYKQSLMQEDNA